MKTSQTTKETYLNSSNVLFCLVKVWAAAEQDREQQSCFYLWDTEELLVPTGRLNAPARTEGFSLGETASASLLPQHAPTKKKKKKGSEQAQASKRLAVSLFKPNMEKINKV